MDYLTMADVWKFTLYFLAGIVMIVSSWVVIQALFPKFVRYGQEAYGQPFRSTLIGLAFGAALFVVIAIFNKVAHGLNLLVVPIGAFGFFLALAGSAGLARRVGNGMQHPTDKDQPWRRTMRGGIALGLTLLVPLANFIPLAIIFITGLGVAVRAFWRMRSEKRTQLTDSPDDEP